MTDTPHKVWQARDGWRVEVRTASGLPLHYGPYSTAAAAEQVAARLVAQLERERGPQAPLPLDIA